MEALKQHPGSAPVILHKNGSRWRTRLSVNYSAQLKQEILRVSEEESVSVWEERAA